MKFLLTVISLVFAAGCTKSAPEVKGKILHLVLKDNVKTVDPVNMYDTVGGDVLYQVYETPYEYNYYSDSQSDLVPALADGMPTLSRDRLTYTFKIKKGIHFQDDPCFKATNGKGRELKAQDFIYGWKRHANPKNESQGYWIFEGKIAGMDAFRKKFGTKPDEEVMAEEIEGMKALDDYTIQLKLTKPYPQLTNVMAMSFTSPVPREAVEHYGKDLTNHPVGTGPFRVVSYNPTNKIVMVRNENFRDERFPSADKLGKKYKHLAEYSGKKLPLVDAIEFTVVKEEQPRWLEFLSGKFDQIQIPKDNFSAAITGDKEVTEDLAKKGIYLSIEPALSYWYVSVNMLDPVLGKNKYLRQAIASAVDAKQWLHIFKNDRGSLQTEVNPPSVPDRCGKPYRWTYDVERAKKLLAKAGYPEGKGLPIIRFDTRGTNMTERQVAEFISKNLAKIGVKIEVSTNTFPIYLDKSHKGNLQLSHGGWVMDYPDAENNYQLLYGPNKAPGPNDSNFDHPEFNKLYEKMALMPSGPARRALICKLEEIVQEEAVWGYGYYENEYRLAQKWLKNFHTAELVFTKWKYVDVDENLKKDLLALR